MNNESGFTLIEAVISLMIVGILAAFAGMAIVTGTKGYVQTRENSHLAQKAQMSMSRIHRELMEITDIEAFDDTGTEPWIIFDNPQGRQAIARVGDTLRLYELNPTKTNLDGETGDLLVDQVTGFSLNFFQGSNAWAVSNKNSILPEEIQLLSALQVGFDLERKEANSTLNFSTTVYPRNTNNFGGAPPTGDPMTASQYECFIKTAAGRVAFPDQSGLRLWVAGNISAVLSIILFVVTVYLTRVTKEYIMSVVSPAIRLRRRDIHSDESGNVLVGLVVTMLIFSALGAGMLSLTSSSTTSQVAASNDVKAYYIAESGFRYAASEFLHASDTGTSGLEDDRNRIIDNLNGNTYNLSGSDGYFRLDMYPYFLTAQNRIDDTTLAVELPGNKPTSLIIPASGKIRINLQTYTYTSYSAYSSTTGEFSGLSPNLPATVPVDTTVKMIAIAPSGQPFVKDGDLNLTSITASIFPELQGKFSVNGIDDKRFGYVRREGDTLKGVYNADNPADDTFNTTLSSATDVIAEPFLQVRSTGTVGEGDLATNRQIVYNTPLLSDPTTLTKAEFYDEFSDDSNLDSATYGSLSITDIGGNNALTVDSVQSSSLGPKSSLIGVNWTYQKIAFANAHRKAGYYLSYDAQTKIGFDFIFPGGTWDTITPDSYDQVGLPKYFVSGIVFRLDENLNTYGLGFTRGSNNLDPRPDNITPGLIFEDQVPIVTLWQLTNNGVTPNWLAYSLLPGTLIFSDDVESGQGAWTASGQWAITSTDSRSTTNSWTDSPGSNYQSNQNTWIESGVFDLSGVSAVTLTFWHKFDIASGDSGRVEISVNGGSTWSSPTFPSSFYVQGHQSSWIRQAVSFNGPFTTNVKFRFRLATNDEGTGQGWWIDDIKILNKDFIDALTSPPLPRYLDGKSYRGGCH